MAKKSFSVKVFALETKDGYLKKGIVGSQPQYTQELEKAKLGDVSDVQKWAKYHCINIYNSVPVKATYEIEC